MSKRKASIPSDSPFYKPPKRAKVSPEDLGHASIDFEEADGVSSDYSCYNDANPPDHNMKEDNPRSETFQFRDKKTAERWMELVWIVRAKENFEQDPSGPPGLSTTTGPLTNAQLRDAFNLRFNKNVGTEACMVRFSQVRCQYVHAVADVRYLFEATSAHIPYTPVELSTKPNQNSMLTVL